jgi:hypothetical protein
LTSEDSLVRLHWHHGCHILIASPTLEAAEEIIQLVSPYARHMACFLLPLSYFTDYASFDMHLWMSSRFHDRRLDILPIPPSLSQEPLVWLRVFPSRAAMSLMLHGSAWDLHVQSASCFFESYDN